MRKIKSFFIGIMLLAIMFASVLLVTLIYRANTNSSVKSYIFQLGNYAGERVGALQNINEISAVDLRNKLIKKYVSEYFSIIPGDNITAQRRTLRALSSPDAYKEWEENESEEIEKMAQHGVFRRVHINDTDIVTTNMPEGYDYYNAVQAAPIYYAVRYMTETWPESNSMGIEPIYESGIIYIEARFKPGIKDFIDVHKHLKSGEPPMELFMFEVTNVGDKEN